MPHRTRSRSLTAAHAAGSRSKGPSFAPGAGSPAYCPTGYDMVCTPEYGCECVQCDAAGEICIVVDTLPGPAPA